MLWWVMVGSLIMPPRKMLSAQLQFWIFFRHVIITMKVLNYFRKVFKKATILRVVEVSI